MATKTDLELDNLEKELPRLVKDLKHVLSAKHEINVPPECDDFIQRCFRLKDFDQEKTIQLVKQFHGMMKDFNKWDAKLEPSVYKKLYYDKFCRIMPETDSNGRHILLIRAGVWDPNDMSYDAALAAIWVMAQYVSYRSLEAQRKGLVIIWDFSSIPISHMWSVKPRRLLNLSVWVQNGAVGRIKSVHVIFHPRIVSVVYAVIRPFLKEKLKNRIQFHGDDLGSLHKHVAPHLLPPYLRGEGRFEDDALYDENFLNELVQQDQFFKDWIERGFPTK